MQRPIVLVHLDIPLHELDSGDKYVPISTQQFRFSDAEYMSPAGVSYDPRISGSITYRRASSCILWSRRPAQSGIGEIELVNVDGALDGMLRMAVRNGRVAVFWLNDASEAPSVSTQIAGGFIDHIESKGETLIRVVTTDILDRLARPITESAYVSGLPQVVGRPRPVAIGQPLSVPVLLVNDIDYYYDAHDISGELAVTLVRDSGFPLSYAVGWQEAPGPNIGIELLREPVGTVVADLSVPATTSTSWIIDPVEGDFGGATWTGGPPTPPGWTIYLHGGGVVEKITSPIAAAKLHVPASSGGGDIARLTSIDTMTAGVRYDVEVVVHDHVFVGELLVLETGSPDRVMMRITEPGTYGISWVAEGGAFRLEVFYSGSGPLPSAVVTLVTVRQRTITPSGPQRWDWALRRLCERAGIAASDIDTMGIEAEGDAWPRNVSFWSSQAPSARSIADQITDSVLALLHSDHRGRVAVKLLEPPSPTAPVDLDVTDIDVIGEIDIAQDRAGNVPRAVSAGRNWHVYRADDLADGIPDEEKAMLSEEFRYRARVGVVGPEIEPRWIVDSRAYRESERSTDVGMPTLLDQQTDAIALAGRIADLWPPHYVARWVQCEIYAQRVALQSLKPGSIVRLTSQRWGMNGVRTVLVEIEGSAGESAAKLLLWFTENASELPMITWSSHDITWDRTDITWSST